MSIEDGLRDSLRRRAASVDAQPDLDDVVERTSGRERRTRRLLTAGLVVALIAGPLAGFAIGRTGDGGGSDVATGGGGREIAAGAGDTAMSSVASGFGGPLEKLFFRTSADGVEIRAYKSGPVPVPVPVPLPAVCEPGTECTAVPAPECIDTFTPSSMIVGELSTDEAVTVASGTAGATSGSDPELAVSAGSWGPFGVEEAAPARWVIASVNESIKRVRATFPSGSTDEMEPVDGVAILASRVDDPDAAGGTLEGLDADGAVVTTVFLTPGFGGVSNSTSGSSGWGSSGGAVDSRAEVHTESSADGSGSSANASSSVSSSVSGGAVLATGCIDPMPTPTPAPAPAPQLPEPGEQPADPAAARTEIERVYLIAMDGSLDDSAAKIATVEDGAAILSAMEAAAQRPNGAAAKASKARVDDVVFTSPTEATVRYAIIVPGITTFEGMVGRAVLDEGTWKVARDTICQNLDLAGVTCPPEK